MSLKAMVWAWEQKIDSPYTKLILLKLADNANEETGLCIPSHASIANHCGCGKRTVIRHIKLLEENGLLKVVNQYRNGRQIQNKYVLYLQNGVGFRGVTETPRGVTAAPPGMSQRHTEPVIVTSKDKEKSIKEKNNNLLTFEKKPDWLPNKILNDFIDHRKQLKKPLTQIGMERLFTKLETIRKQDGDPIEAINNSILSGYQGVFASTSNNPPRQGISHGNNKSSTPPRRERPIDVFSRNMSGSDNHGSDTPESGIVIEGEVL